MIQEALDYLVEIGKNQFQREKIHGVEYQQGRLEVIKPPRCTELSFSRLLGFADFINANKDALEAALSIHIASAVEARYFGPLAKDYRDREVYAVAKFGRPSFPFGSWMDPENFVIQVQTLFDEDDAGERARLLALGGNIASEQIQTKADDGVSQTVTVKGGIALVRRADIVNPFKLRPHRTFAEVDQPVSPFILRARRDGDREPQLALFECDNGAWQIAAIVSIKEWLTAHVTAQVAILG